MILPSNWRKDGSWPVFLPTYSGPDAPTVRDGVSFVRAWEQFDERGRLREPALAERAMARLLTQLEWWARALREARQARPYAECLA